MATLVVVGTDPYDPLAVVANVTDVVMDPALAVALDYRQVLPLPLTVHHADPANVAAGNYQLAFRLVGEPTETYRIAALIYDSSGPSEAATLIYTPPEPPPLAPMVFTPPTSPEVPTNGAQGESPVASRLMQYYNPRPRGVAVFKMDDGSYCVSRSLAGIIGVDFREPWPPVVVADQVNNTMATAWAFCRVIRDFPQVPGVAIVYYGGMSYQVSGQEAADLTAAGLGAYLE